MAEANRPIVRGFFATAATYYTIIIPLHFMALSGINLFIMVLAATLALFILSSVWRMSKTPQKAGKLEAMAGAANFSAFTNVMLALHTSHDPTNLIYFIMMALGFAFTSVSMRMAIASISIVLGSLYFELTFNFPDAGANLGYFAFAAAFTGLAVATFLRMAITTTINAKEAAENKLIKAEHLSMKMRQRALSDSLTGLPNRRAFFKVLNETSVRKSNSNDSWLVLLDLDGFKMVNDVYGHIMGDRLLKAVTKRLTTYCASGAHVSRMGGDEFNIVLFEVGDEHDCKTWCEELLRNLAEPYEIEDRLIQISASVGSINTTYSQKIGQLIRNADYALLHAKKHGKNRVTVFNELHAKNATEQFAVEDALRSADFTSEIEILFQPQFDLGRNQVIRAEALARWESPELGKIEPDRFIKIAEECGLISKITLAVLAKTVEALKSWDVPIPLSINLSGHDLLSNQIMSEIIEVLASSDLDPALLEFEVTETAMMADTEKACANLNRLSKLGYSIALDDFGTGYSNFNYLRELPINKLKVDRSFVEDIGNPMTEKILHSLAVTASALGVDCLLEGIEDELQLIMAKRVGAQSVQGYLFGRPMANNALIDLINGQETQLMQTENFA